MRPGTLLLLALASGGTASVMALRYLQEERTPILTPSGEGRKIAVAARGLPVGTVLTPQDIRLLDWGSPSIPPGFLGTPEEVIGRGLITPLQENEPILEGKLGGKGQGGGLSLIIPEGMRAVSVRVDEVIGVAGFVLPGTRVDVLVTLTGQGTEGRSITRIILQNVATLAAGQSVEQDRDGKPRAVTAITLLTSPAESELLTLASTQGRIQLALRNTLDTLEVGTTGAALAQLQGVNPAPAPAASARRRVEPAVLPIRPVESRTVIEGFRGGQRTLTTFSNTPPDSEAVSGKTQP